MCLFNFCLDYGENVLLLLHMVIYFSFWERTYMHGV
jgi:hypothetical protein